MWFGIGLLVLSVVLLLGGAVWLLAGSLHSVDSSPAGQDMDLAMDEPDVENVEVFNVQ